MKKLIPPIALLFVFVAGSQAQPASDFFLRFANHNFESVILPDSNIYYPSTHGFTWEMWVFPDSIPTGHDSLEDVNRAQAFLSVEDGVPAEDIAIGIGWGEVTESWLTFEVDGIGGAYGRDPNYPHYVLPTPHKWYHVAGVCSYDSGFTRLFVDGVPIGSSYFMKNMGSGFHPLTRNIPVTIGNAISRLGNGFIGMLDEVMIWDNPRKDVDVKDDKNACFTGLETGLVAYYRLNEGDGTITYDWTPHQLTGHLNNGPQWVVGYPPSACYLSTDFKELSEDAIKIYPNPVSGFLILQAFSFQPETVVIYDLNGREVMQQKFTHQVDISALDSGVYLVELRNTDSAIRKKTVKL